MKNRRISIAIPASIVSDVPTLQLKTYKIGQVARALAIYCVDEVLVFPDLDHWKQKKDSSLVCQILRYLETPQYLRKRLFPLSSELRFAGILPPLNTPNHPTGNRIATLADGEFREGVAVGSSKNGSLIDVGVEKPLETTRVVASGDRRTFKVIKRSGEEAKLELADSSDINKYWGYKVVELREKLGAFMGKREFDLTILTSRLGLPITHMLTEIEDRLQRSEKIFIGFGSPKEGLRQILAREGSLEKTADLIINTIPGQGTQSVRTEEAVHGTLAIINMLIRRN